ncbi:uncharacterized protein LOC130655377 [Hydractinia symbiolongicarpus]|uniref:uncharacterized protein LOC130655377 n=1 Tax=Hydractinia symbiolongicarpus TaxID=13093 RepID=UPI00254A44FC|nr:uncharacterized protein LOC130655377 [Hydractinia symbiolongicarpus]XP_057314110.1 uncharacterized protein LOC130655377 [Hydractinia symbiolongicarpus]
MPMAVKRFICNLLLLLNIYAISETLSWKVWLKNSTKQHQNISCERGIFTKTYVDKDLFFHEASMKQLQQKCSSRSFLCNSAKIQLQFMTDEHTSVPHTNIIILNLSTNENQDCWGYIAEVQGSSHISFQYINVYKKASRIELIKKVEFNSTYVISITSIPANIKAQLTLNVPNQCEVDALLELHHNFPSLIDSTCHVKKLQNQYSAFSQKRRIAKQLCNIHPESGQDRFKALQNVRRTYCDYNLEGFNNKNKNEEEDKNIFNVDIPLAFVILSLTLIILSITFVKMFKHISIKLFSNMRSSSTLLLEEKNVRSVLILHRSGCDILERFLRDFAYILTIHDIEVRTTLLEQSTLDSAGGIASFLQRNIQSCDYILILITEQRKEPPLLKHKPYEFALQIISGIALNTNNCSRYFPLYLSSYQETVSWFPSFLLAAKHKGFKIPDELEKLLRVLNGKISNPDNKHVIILNRMKTLAKKMKEKEHLCCFRDKCDKGKRFISASSLCSVWQSVDSICSRVLNERINLETDVMSHASQISSNSHTYKWNSVYNLKTHVI